MSGAALLLATHPDPELRDPAAAVRLARRASELTSRKDAGTMGILATCYAAADQHEEAAAAEKEAAALMAASTAATPARAAGLARQYRGTRALDP